MWAAFHEFDFATSGNKFIIEIQTLIIEVEGKHADI